MGSGPGKARLRALRALTYDTWEYAFEMAEPEVLSFRPGQFVSIGCGLDAQGVAARRSYSIASSAAHSDHFKLVVKLVPGGLASTFFASLGKGGEIEFTGPMGFFVLDLAHEGDIVFAATGTGIAPVRPMLQELAGRRAEHGQIRLFWGIRE